MNFRQLFTSFLGKINNKEYKKTVTWTRLTTSNTLYNGEEVCGHPELKSYYIILFCNSKEKMVILSFHQ